MPVFVTIFLSVVVISGVITMITSCYGHSDFFPYHHDHHDYDGYCCYFCYFWTGTLPDFHGFSKASAPEQVDLGRSMAQLKSRPPFPVAWDLALSRVHLLPTLKDVRKMEGYQPLGVHLVKKKRINHNQSLPLTKKNHGDISGSVPNLWQHSFTWSWIFAPASASLGSS